MSFPFGRNFFRRAFRMPVDPMGQRLIGLTLDGRNAIWAPKGHSSLLSAAGGGKTTSGGMNWLFSYLASEPNKAVLVPDSKDGEFAHQAMELCARIGRPTALIDDTGVFPDDCPHRVAVNPFGAAVAVHRRSAAKLPYVIANITNTAIEEPENDARNRYWRASPRLLIEFAIRVLLKRDPARATPGGVAALLCNPDMLRAFAAIEVEEGNAALKAVAVNVLEMSDHEHWPQHLEAAQDALRIFGPGSQLHSAGLDATVTHADLIGEGRVIFLAGPQAFINRLGLYYGLHIMAFAEALYSGAGTLRVIGDEITNAPVKELASALTTLRAYGGEVHFIAQSRSEIERRFGQLGARTIDENAIVKQWFGFSSFEEAERVSKAMGEEYAVTSSLGADNESLRLQTNLQLVKQPRMSPSELMAMPPHLQLVHVKGVGFFLARKIGQHQVAPYCHQIAPNPLEGGRLKPDPKITLTIPRGVAS